MVAKHSKPIILLTYLHKIGLKDKVIIENIKMAFCVASLI